MATERKELEVKKELKSLLLEKINFMGTPQEIEEKVYEIVEVLYITYLKHSRALSTDLGA